MVSGVLSGLKLFMTLAERGEQGYCDMMIEHQARMGDLMRELLRASGWQIVNDHAAARYLFYPRGDSYLPRC